MDYTYGEIVEFEMPEVGVVTAGIQYDVPDVDSDKFIFSARFMYAPALPFSPRHAFVTASNSAGTQGGKISIYDDRTNMIMKVEIIYGGSLYEILTQIIPDGAGILDPGMWCNVVIAINGSRLSVQFGYIMWVDATLPPELADPFVGVSRIQTGLVDCGTEGDFALWWDDLRWDEYSSVVFDLNFEGADGATTWDESARNYEPTLASNCQIDGVEKDGALQTLRMGVTAYVLGTIRYEDIFLVKIGSVCFSFGFKYEGGDWTVGQNDRFDVILGIKPGRFPAFAYPNLLQMSLTHLEEGSPAEAIPIFMITVTDPGSGTQYPLYATYADIPKPDEWHHVKIQVYDEFLYFIMDNKELGRIAFGSSMLSLPISSMVMEAVTGWSGIRKVWVSDITVENDQVYNPPSKEFMAWDFDPCAPLLGNSKSQTDIFI